MDREELTDLIADAISDSIDMDWSASIGARYVVEALIKEGLVTETHPTTPTTCIEHQAGRPTQRLSFQIKVF